MHKTCLCDIIERSWDSRPPGRNFWARRVKCVLLIPPSGIMIMATVAAQRPISHHLRSDNKGCCRLCVGSDTEEGGGVASVCDSPEVVMTHRRKKKSIQHLLQGSMGNGEASQKNPKQNELNAKQGEYSGGMARHVIPLRTSGIYLTPICQISCINIDQFSFNRRLMSDQYIRAGDAGWEGDGEGLCLWTG